MKKIMFSLFLVIAFLLPNITSLAAKQAPLTINRILHPGENMLYWRKYPEWLETGRCLRNKLEAYPVIDDSVVITVYYWDMYYDWQPLETISLPLGQTKAEDEIWPQVSYVTADNIYVSSILLTKSDVYTFYCYVSLPIAFKNVYGLLGGSSWSITAPETTEIPLNNPYP